MSPVSFALLSFDCLQVILGLPIFLFSCQFQFGSRDVSWFPQLVSCPAPRSRVYIQADGSLVDSHPQSSIGDLPPDADDGAKMY